MAFSLFLQYEKLNRPFSLILKALSSILQHKKHLLKFLIAIESQLRFIVLKNDCRHRKRPQSRQRYDPQ